MEPMIPKVFMSYSWSSKEHEDWVKMLVDRLRDDVIEVQFDKYDLNAGHDSYKYMESMVTSKEIDKVLIVMDEKYTVKANSREGGVGTETQIISREIYEHTEQTKFIPIVREKDEDGKPFIPVFLRSRIYIDMSPDNDFEEEYEKLVRIINDKPLLKKPPLGKQRPTYLDDPDPLSNRTRKYQSILNSQVDKHPKRINHTTQYFLEAVHLTLDEYVISLNTYSNSEEIGKAVFEGITRLTSIRNEYSSFLFTLLRSQVDFDIALYIDFLGSLGQLQRYREQALPTVDHLKFLSYELFLYTVAITLKTQRFDVAEELLYSQYEFDTGRGATSQKSDTFEVFYQPPIEALKNYYNRRPDGKKLVNPQAHLIDARVDSSIGIVDLVTADYLCYYISILRSSTWFPQLYIYKGEYDSLKFFSKLTSLRYFNKVKLLFGVDSVEAFKALPDTYPGLKAGGRGYHELPFRNILPLSTQLEINKVGTLR